MVYFSLWIPLYSIDNSCPDQVWDTTDLSIFFFLCIGNDLIIFFSSYIFLHSWFGNQISIWYCVWHPVVFNNVFAKGETKQKVGSETNFAKRNLVEGTILTINLIFLKKTMKKDKPFVLLTFF